MMRFTFIFLGIVLFFITETFAQTHAITLSTSVSEAVVKSFHPTGRIFLFIGKYNGREPRLNTWPSQTNFIFATNLENWKVSESFVFGDSTKVVKSVDVSPGAIPAGEYHIQVLWDQDTKESGINAPGNLYSEPLLIKVNQDLNLEMPLVKVIEPRKLAVHPLLKEVDIKSQVLSNWWGKEIRLKAAVVLPRNFSNEPNRKYAVRYNIAGYGGRYTRANHFLDYMDWWTSNDAPQILNVYLDGEGPFGDSYQLDSENSGPYGKALTQELIPYIEKEFRALGTPKSRFVEGCSTGGWVSLALQLFYPDFFGGCFSYSPDQVDFENCQLVNIYADENAFYNEYGYLRPIVRDISGEPVISQKDFIRFENVLGTSDTYLNSGGQFSAFNALFSPKGENGLPRPLFDPVTGEIDHQVSEYWRKHDLKDYVEKNWKTLGPKIKGKIWAWCGDMDDFYLNPALRAFDEMLKEMDHPKSDAVILFSPMKGHCDEYNEIKVIQQIAEKFNGK